MTVATKPTFAVGDRVKPKRGWDTYVALAAGQLPPLPAGKVLKVAPYGKGQVLYVEGDKRAFLSGCFEREAGK